MPPLANKIVPYAAKVSWLTPNIVSFSSFIMYVIASLLLFTDIPNHLLISLILFPLSYIADCMDGQLARTTKRFSPIGDYLDKTLDVLKIFIITASLSWAVYSQTLNVLYIYLGFAGCFFFCYRYYIKHEILYSQFSKDHSYLDKSYERIMHLYESVREHRAKLSTIHRFWLAQRTIFYVDEGEFIFFTCLGIIFGRLDLSLWVIGISQTVWGIYRLIMRAVELKNRPEIFINPVKR
jgi:phosphatidylglycerophosphate synthase